MKKASKHIHPTAIVDDGAQIGLSTKIWHWTHICSGAKIGKRLLKVKPGITDFSSIVFSDESEILKDVYDPDITYNQLIRPWKSKLGLFYIQKQSLQVDVIIISLTFISIFSRRISLQLLHKTLKKLNAPRDLLKLVLRQEELKPMPPPGANEIVRTRT